MRPWDPDDDQDAPRADIVLVRPVVVDVESPADGSTQGGFWQRWLHRHQKLTSFVASISEGVRRTRVGKFFVRHPRIGYFCLALVLLVGLFKLLSAPAPVVWPPASVLRYGPQLAEAGEQEHTVKPALLMAIMTVESCGNPEYFPYEGMKRGLMGTPVSMVEEPDVLDDPGNSIILTAEILAAYAENYPTPADPTDPEMKGYLSYAEYLVLSYALGGPAAIYGITEEGRRNLPQESLTYAANVMAIFREGQVGSSATFERMLKEDGAFRQKCDAAKTQMQKEQEELRNFAATEAANANQPQLGNDQR